jgi:uncharacterized membrane protein
MDTRRKRKLTGAAVGAGLMGAAVATELRKPRRKRTWHGRILGFVPYDFRPPTLKRARKRWWNPQDSRVLTPRMFGVGWDVNFGRLLRPLTKG